MTKLTKLNWVGTILNGVSALLVGAAIVNRYESGTIPLTMIGLALVIVMAQMFLDLVYRNKGNENEKIETRSPGRQDRTE
jgi:hypothetical protein